ncbi:MAG: DUF1415 domain-containing protein [Planctomycetota bacterium]|nr:DUF1415 domain-containing protein [Planctomycetota bacterium]MDA1249638.1 DUF1415 domain-containing protein [Planctomycetota bacterium]
MAETSMGGVESDRVRKWVEQAVIGLGLCPFAGEHWQAGRVRLAVTKATTQQTLLSDLGIEIAALDEADPKRLETTLLIVPGMLLDFDDYNQFLDLTEALIQERGWEGRFQIASFHPDYQFAGTELDDPGNLTNRSPFPILHILRESSVSRALAGHPDPDQIPLANIARLKSLSAKRRAEIFGSRPQN